MHSMPNVDSLPDIKSLPVIDLLPNIDSPPDIDSVPEDDLLLTIDLLLIADLLLIVIATHCGPTCLGMQTHRCNNCITYEHVIKEGRPFLSLLCIAVLLCITQHIMCEHLRLM